MARSIPLSDENEIAAFLSLPAVGATELHVTEAKRPPTKKRSKKLRTLDVVDEVVLGVTGGDLLTTTDGKDLRSRLEVGWVGPAGMLAQVGMTPQPESYQQVLAAARTLGVGVRLFSHDDNQLFDKTRSRGSLYVPRHPERLEAGRFQNQIIDTADLFDASIGRMHVPGKLSQKVRRKQPVHMFEQYRQDRSWTRIDIQSKKKLMTFETLNTEFLGVIRCNTKVYALSTTEIFELKKQFCQQTNFGTWACDRLMMRLGI